MRALVAVLALAVVSAGCAGAPTDGSTTTETATPTPDPVLTGASDRPDPDKRVTLENEWNATVAVDLRVVRAATGETVHEATHEVAAGEEREVYSTAAADPEGVETFRVVASARNETQKVVVETDTCYGGVYGVVRADGGFDLFYAVC
jgi:hypothetical protein